MGRCTCVRRVTREGWVENREGIGEDETHAVFTRRMGGVVPALVVPENVASFVRCPYHLGYAFGEEPYVRGWVMVIVASQLSHWSEAHFRRQRNALTTPGQGGMKGRLESVARRCEVATSEQAARGNSQYGVSVNQTVSLAGEGENSWM